MKRREFTIFIIFSDTYTCSYVVFKVSPDSDQNWIFYEFLKLLKNRVKVPGLMPVYFKKLHFKSRVLRITCIVYCTSSGH